MATMAMEREPEVAGFMEHYKYDQHQSEAYRKYGGGTSLPLNSDGLEERQRRLRDERHKDWMQQQEKQKKLEGERMEARRRISPPRQRPPPGMDYNYVQEQSRAMDKKAYQDYMKQKQERELALRGRPVTPPGGLDIGQYDRRLKEEGPQKKKEYKAMLDQQKQEHMFLRARQEHEIPVIERNTGRLPVQSPSHLANKPPPGPNHRPREEMDHERRRHDEIRQNAESTKPMPVVKNAYYGSEEHEAYVQKQKQQLGQEYLDYLNKDQSNQRAQEPRRHEYMDTSKSPYEGGLFNNLGEHGGSKDKLMEQRRQEYNEHLQHNQRPTGRPNWVKEPLPNDHHGGRRPEQAADRQYEAMLEEKRREESLRRRYDPDMSYPRNGEGASRERQYRPGY